MQKELKILRRIPDFQHNTPVLFVYNALDEEDCPVGCVPYGLLLTHREHAPEWMVDKIAMTDMAYDPSSGDIDIVQDIGYRGSVWYVIFGPPEHAEKAGINTTDLVAP